jgi:ABC-type uncharacterized transport system auxiliary subunit
MTRRVLFALTLVPLAAGCGLNLSPRPVRPVRYYSIEPDLPAPQKRATPDLVLAVQPLEAASRYGERILRRDKGNAVEYHEHDRWVEPPAEMLSRALVRALAGAARTVVDGRLVRRADVALEGRVTRFDQAHTDDGWQAVCELEMVLKHDEDGRVLLATHVLAARPVASADPAAFVQAMDAAAGELLAKASDAVAKALAELK